VINDQHAINILVNYGQKNTVRTHANWYSSYELQNQENGSDKSPSHL